MIEQGLYNEIIALIPIVCVDVAIAYDNKILLIKRGQHPAKDEWWLPGGRLFKGETLEDCAIRKAKEETGLDCELGPMVHYASTDFSTIHSVNFCYVLFASDDKVRLDDTCLDYEWTASISNLHPYVKRCVSYAFDCLLTGVSRYE